MQTKALASQPHKLSNNKALASQPQVKVSQQLQPKNKVQNTKRNIPIAPMQCHRALVLFPHTMRKIRRIFIEVKGVLASLVSHSQPCPTNPTRQIPSKTRRLVDPLKYIIK